MYISDLENAIQKLKKFGEVELLSIVEKDEFDQDDMAKWRLGLSTGCAGYGLKLMIV